MRSCPPYTAMSFIHQADVCKMHVLDCQLHSAMQMVETSAWYDRHSVGLAGPYVQETILGSIGG